VFIVIIASNNTSSRGQNKGFAMARIVCTSRLEHVGPGKSVDYPVSTVRELLQAVAVDYPALNNYVLDDQGKVRKHVAIFIGGTLQAKHSVLEQTLAAEDEVYIMQALSGG
jgi:molybdopterin converting factor small subunit